MDRDKLAEQFVFRAARWGFLAGIVCGIIGGFPIFGIGALFGMFMGAPIGMALGGAVGLLLGIVTTSLFPKPYVRPIPYRITLAIVCTTISAVTMYSLAKTNFYPSTVNAEDYYFRFLPAVVALAALYVSQRIADWYLTLN